MIAALFFVFLIYLLIHYIIDPIKGVYIYIFACLFFPYISLFSVTFRIELLVVPFLVAAVLVRNKERTIVPSVLLIWLLFVTYCVVVSFFKVPDTNGSSLNYLEFYNYLRFGGLIIIGANSKFSRADLLKLSVFFFYLSVPIAILALGVASGNALATNITQIFYTSPSRIVFENQIAYIDSGYSFRSIGVFENVSFYASYLLVVLMLGVTFVLNKQIDLKSIKNRILFIIVIIINLLAGVSTSSLTFYVGVVFIFIYIVIKKPLVSIRLVLGLLAIFVIFGAIFYNKIAESAQQYIDVFQYLYHSFLNGDKLGERYALSGRENGNLTNIIHHSWFSGNGFRSYDKVVVNDSLFLEFFYQAGVLGGLILLFFIGVIFFNSFKKPGIKNQKIYLVFSIILIAGLGCNSISIVRLTEWLWILIGMLSTAGLKRWNNETLESEIENKSVL